jgi:hypothetical protein
MLEVQVRLVRGSVPKDDEGAGVEADYHAPCAYCNHGGGLTYLRFHYIRGGKVEEPGSKKRRDVSAKKANDLRSPDTEGRRWASDNDLSRNHGGCFRAALLWLLLRWSP